MRYVISTLFAALLVVGLAAPAAAQMGNTAVIVTATIAVDEQAVTATDLRDIYSFAVSVQNAGTYQLEFEASFDGGLTWVPTYGTEDDAAPVIVTLATAPGRWFFANRGYSRFRVRASAYTSGTPIVHIIRGYGR